MAFRGVPGQVPGNAIYTYEFDCGWAQIDHSVARCTFLALNLLFGRPPWILLAVVGFKKGAGLFKICI